MVKKKLHMLFVLWVHVGREGCTHETYEEFIHNFYWKTWMEEIILKGNIQIDHKLDVSTWSVLMSSQKGPLVDSNEHHNKPSEFIKGWNFLTS
jgi:hypothetical protein